MAEITILRLISAIKYDNMQISKNVNLLYRKDKIMKFIKSILTAILIVGISSYAFAGVKLIGDLTCIKRLMNGNDHIKLLRVVDPDNPFVAIFFTTVKSGDILALADPSNTAIAARLVRPIPIKDGKRLIDKTSRTNIASLSKSIGTKEMKIARYYDAEMDTLCYIVYTTKLIGGSLKHSLSVVPLGNPLGLK